VRREVWGESRWARSPEPASLVLLENLNCRCSAGRIEPSQELSPSPHFPCGEAPGVACGFNEEPANTLRPSASVMRAAFAVFDPSLARYASTVIRSPGLSEFFVQPSRMRP